MSQRKSRPKRLVSKVENVKQSMRACVHMEFMSLAILLRTEQHLNWIMSEMVELCFVLHDVLYTSSIASVEKPHEISIVKRMICAFHLLSYLNILCVGSDCCATNEMKGEVHCLPIHIILVAVIFQQNDIQQQ